jgi:hypothetical protein
LIKLFDAGYGKFHVVGFSLGAQIASRIGRYVISKSKQKYILPRITGLDPGQIPSFFNTAIPELNVGDATFVDVIHGESNLFGSTKSKGNVTFWINGGYIQPSCRASFSLRKQSNISYRGFKNRNSSIWVFQLRAFAVI